MEGDGETMGKECRKSKLEDVAIESISERLCAISDIYLPQALAGRGQTLSNHEKKSHLASVLRRDAAIFLERYGQNLNSAELQEFEVLQDDYEVDWHLKELKKSLCPTVQERKSRNAAVKNRRLAYMDRLVQDGQFFSEDSMRMRSPLLHHEYVGQFQDPSIRGAARPGERFSEMLIRQSEEAFIQQRLNEERIEAGMAEATVQEETEESEDEEEESEDEDTIVEDDEDTSDEEQMQADEQVFGEFSHIDTHDQNKQEEVANCGNLPAHLGNSEQTRGSRESHLQMQNKLQAFADTMQHKFLSEGEQDELNQKQVGSTLSEIELQDKLHDFTRLMKEKFLSGGDSEYIDYSRIDNDSTLDDHWLREISRDAEEKYFEED